MTIAIAYGDYIQPYNTDTRENKRIKSKLTYHCSFICQWILAWCVLHLFRHPSVCSFCNVIHHSRTISLSTKLHINQYSFSSYNISALYQLHIFQNLFFSSSGLFYQTFLYLIQNI